MRDIMYKNSRIFGGKAYAYQGWNSTMKGALASAREIRRVNNYSVRIVKVRDGYNLYGAKRQEQKRKV